MGSCQVKKNRHRSRLFALLAVSICTFADPAVAADTEAAQDATLGEITVPWPVVDYTDSEIGPHSSPDDDTEFPLAMRPLRSLQLLRARNLFAAGHYEEAIVEYEQGLPQWDVSVEFKKPIEFECSLACEKVGLIDDAIKHAKLADANVQLARLYYRQGRLAAAKAILDKINATDEYDASNLAYLAHSRAAVLYRMGQYKKAFRDLKVAAQNYQSNDSTASAICVQTVNALIERYNLGARFELQTLALPIQGKKKVFALIGLLANSTNPLCIEDLNRIIGSSIVLPTDPTHNSYQQELKITPFRRVDLSTRHDDLKVPSCLRLDINKDACCITEHEVDAYFPSNAIKITPFATCTEIDESSHAVAWKLPTGRLYFEFDPVGSRALIKVEFNTLNPQQKVSALQLKTRADNYHQQYEKKVDALNEAVKLDDQDIELFLDRSNTLCDLGRFDEALADAKHVVSVGGRFYLDQQSKVEEKMGRINDAIVHYKILLGDHPPGPETASRYTQLARLYLMTRQYTAALEASKKALIDSKDTDAAFFVKAQAEAGLGNLDKARADAKRAADGYFSKAQIVLRDRVLDWVKTL